ncbi:MAG: hypothetical protein WA087_01555, partial [Candidatus Saccharimonadales bacterium]
TNPPTFTLDVFKGDTTYRVTDDSAPVAVVVSGSDTFAMAWGGTDEDSIESMAQTSDGGYITTGKSQSNLSGVNDMFIAKYDSNLNLTWNNTWGGTSEDRANSIKQTSDGGYIVAGWTYSFGVGGWDSFLVKYDSSGNVVWNKTWGGPGMDRADSVAQTADGGYIVSGTYAINGGDSYIAKYDSDGNIVWNKTWGGSEFDEGSSVIQTSDNGYMVTGTTNSFGGGYMQLFLIKYDSDGNMSWNNVYSGLDYTSSESIVQTSDGGYAIAGSVSGSGVNAGGCDTLLAKFNSSGNLTWDAAWGSEGDDSANSVVQTSDGGFAITGNTTLFDEYDMIIIKYDSGGVISWKNTFGNTSDDTNEDGNSIVQTIDGGYTIGGHTDLMGAQGIDSLMVKFSSSGTISGCPAQICQTPAGVTSSPSGTTMSPSATITTPSITATAPSATIGTISGTATTVVSPQ